MSEMMFSSGGRRASRYARAVLVGAVVVGAAIASAAADASAAPFAYQPITIQRINLPSNIKSAGWPVFTHDGRHLLFFSVNAKSAGNTGQPGVSELWISNLRGRGVHCLSCGLANDPRANGEGEVTPFPDGKRVFFGGSQQPGSSKLAVLECSPSIVHCATAKILPVDFSPAQPATVPPGGAVSIAQTDLGGAYAAKLSQDGVHVAFSDARSDALEIMVIGKLQRTANKYEVTNPRVINPPGPTSTSDRNIAHWSNSSALYEFKTFTHGGADATYVESGGASLLNPDVWSINLATGRRTRLTSNPDWDEDDAVSPNGKLLALWSNRTMHFSDWFSGLLPVRDFIDAPAAAMASAAIGANKRCHGPMWVLPSGGDRGGALAGEPIVYYRVPHVFVTNNLVGWAQWSPSGTMLALNTTNNSPGAGYPPHAPFLLVAHFTALRPTRPQPAVSSQPGSWAPAPAEYHPALGYKGTVTFRGAGGGTVTIEYPGSALAGQWSETYAHYSENGTDFVNGAVTITGSFSGGTYSSHLTMTGTHTGSDNAEVTLRAGHPSGHAKSTYDGHTITGPSAAQRAGGACPGMQPKEPALHVNATSLGNGVYKVKVTVSVAGVGANEAAVDTEPVYHATITLGHAKTYTDHQGIAIVTARRDQRLMVAAGDTLRPTAAHLRTR
jgi:hypothetical protein